ncbi:MAG: PEP-CTERM sorting domain-containing protein [Acidobacteria bacterium]|nr:PEP-CTERM sorting domain-containing protein [Acidobacteriota bacterium]
MPAVPEPSAVILLGSGLALIALGRRLGHWIHHRRPQCRVPVRRGVLHTRV